MTRLELTHFVLVLNDSINDPEYEYEYSKDQDSDREFLIEIVKDELGLDVQIVGFPSENSGWGHNLIFETENDCALFMIKYHQT